MNSQTKYTKAEISNLTFAYITGWLPKGIHFKTKQKLEPLLYSYTECENEIDSLFIPNFLKSDTDRSIEFKVISSDLCRSFEAVKYAARRQGFTVEVKPSGKNVMVAACKGELVAHFMINREGEIYATMRIKGNEDRFPGVPARGRVEEFIVDGEKYCQKNYA